MSENLSQGAAPTLKVPFAPKIELRQREGPKCEACDRAMAQCATNGDYVAFVCFNTECRNMVVIVEPLSASSLPLSRKTLSEPTPEQEREVDDLLREFQRACEDAAHDLAAPGARKERAILRNELRARLLAADEK